MVDLSQHEISDLDPEQLEFLLRRLKRAERESGSRPEREGIPLRLGEGPWPLSFAQQRLWFLHQLEHRSAASHILMAVDLAGRVQPARLAAALVAVARRHEALRTTFDLADGHPVQVIHPDLELSLPLADLTVLAAGARQAELSRLAGIHLGRPFDLVRGPLLRGLVVRQEAARFRLFLVLHHVAADNWSVLVLMREVSALYDSLATGRPAHLTKLPIQYVDYALWQRRRLQGDVLANLLAYWRRRLDGAPPRLELPADHPRPEIPSFRFGRLVFRVPEDLTQGLKTLGRRRGTTLFNVLLAAFNALLHRYTGAEDIVLGSPVANRRHTEIEGLIGFFFNTLLMRNRPTGRLTFEQFLAEVHEGSLGAFAHQDLPFEKLVEELRPERDASYQPLFRVMFNVYDGALPELRFAGLEVERIEVQIGTWNDLDLLLAEAGNGLDGYLRYSADLFEPATAEALAESFLGLLGEIVRAPETRLADLAFSTALGARAEAARWRERRPCIAVSATFTAEPLGEVLDFWMRELDVPARVAFAPYGQVFQQLLDAGSLMRANRHGWNVILVRLEDWAGAPAEATDGGGGRLGEPAALAGIERNARDLIAALEQAARQGAVAFLVVLCPASPAAAALAPFRAAASALAERMRLALSDSPGVYLISEAELAGLYPVAGLHDPYTDRIGHVPYSLPGFAALGTLISRRIHALLTPPVKVIAVDCDQTLWKGVCGEDGPHGVALDPARRRLQEFLLAQQQAGVLLCLCSKNEEEDVWSTFDQRDDFPLRREHLAAWRINWSPKAENLRALAGELGLGLDSFVLIDDNPVECAAVRAGCPEAAVLELPADEAAIPRMVRHFWAFDRLRTTAEDRERTALYRQMRDRERHRRAAPSFADFLAGLELAIEVVPMAPDELARVAQLTARTNQFNASTIRRDEGEIQRLLAEGALECRVVKVRDRFGDHGLTGAVFFCARAGILDVDTFLLSCRVLGRGVEHRVLSALGDEAAARGCGRVDVKAVPTARNRPVFDFLRAAAGACETPADGGSLFRIPAAVARGIVFSPLATTADQAAAEGDDDGAAAPGSRALSAAVLARSRRLLRIAQDLHDPREVRRRIEEGKRRSAATGVGTGAPPRNATEERLAGIFAEVLGLERVGIDAGFFDLGGHSLLGTVLLSRVRDAFAVELPVSRLFQAQTVEALAAVLETERARPAATGAESIRRESGPEPASAARAYPASYLQEGLWFLHQLEPESPVYNIPMVLRLAGRLRHGALARSLQEIVRRHWTLRTAFAAAGRGVVQVVSPLPRLAIPLLDLSGLPPAARERELGRRLDEEARRAFDLASAPLFRLALVRLGAAEHVLDLVVHHAVFDGWSMGVLLREFAACYRAYSHGDPSPLAGPPIQYVDFARWQRERLESGGLAAQLAYWRERLASRPPPLALPADRPRPARWSFRGAARAVELPAALAAALARLARESGASLFMTLLAAVDALLLRITGESDLAIGSPVANRNRTELEDLIGLFANTLVLRVRAREAEGFRALLTEVRTVALAAYAHQDLPFEKLVEELRPERDLSRSPLFQVMFILQNAPLPPIALPDLTLSVVDLARTTARFDLLLELAETGGKLRGLLEYGTDLFEAATAARITRHFESLLTAIAADPERPLAELALLAPAERCQLLVEWNDTVARYPAELCLHQLVEAQVARSPGAVAIRDERGSLTYRELELRANRLARRLRAAGLGPDLLAAVLLERSTETVVALLGVLEAGGAYLPLDPTLPRKRMAFILEDAAPRVVVTRSELLDLLPERPAGLAALCLDALDAEKPEGGEPDLAAADCGASERGASNRAAADPANSNRATLDPADSASAASIRAAFDSADSIPAASSRGVSAGRAGAPGAGGPCPDNLAYVIYTSGSTGRPKGVEVCHRSMVNFLAAMRGRPGIAAGDVLLAVTTLSFDIAGLELFLPLTVGAQVVMVSRETAADGVQLARALEQSGATVLQATPATWRLLLAAGWNGKPDLAALCGGEALPREVAEQLLVRTGSLWNLYGPTETTVWSALHRVESAARAVPAGRPIANTAIYVLDAGFAPAPIGVPGELAIGGVGLARGYRGQPGLTAERFVPDPFGAPGSRLYRTGDLARWLAEGALDFLGRTDHQVKIRGFRVETQEIEAVLAEHPGVAEAAVLARDGADGRRLVAYLVARPGEAPAAAELRSTARAALPEYMVPAAFVFLPAMPLTPNGKLDRKALPAVDDLPRQTGLVPPRTSLEELLVEIWAQVLDVQRLSVDDNVFDLGAHSLLATQVRSRLDRELGIDLPLRRLFELPTVALLAADIESCRATAAERRIPPLTRAPRDGALPLSFAQQRIWFFDRWESGSAVFNLPTAVELAGDLDAAALGSSVHEIVRRHEILRCRFLDLGGEPALVIDPFTPRPFPLVDLARLPAPRQARECERLARAEARRPFDLARGPLLRATLLRLAPREHLALLTLHHIVADGWSLWIFTREMSAAYQDLAAGRAPRLPELPIQFADYAAWQRAWLAGEVLGREVSFWQEQLAGAPEALDLPFDRPRGPVQRYRGARRGFALPRELPGRLRALGRASGATLFMTLLTAWKALLRRYSNQSDLSTGTVIANRNRRELEGLIGFFINTLVLRVRLEESFTFRQAAASIREMTLEAYAHQDVPFEKLVEELNPARHLSLPPLFQVMLVLQNTPAATLSLPGLRLALREVERDTVNYDLVFFLEDRGEGLSGVLDYDVDLFDGATIDRLLAHFGSLLQALVEEPDRRLLEAPLLGPAERQQLLREWNDSAATSPAPAATLSEMFERQAAARPDAWAAVSGGERITYGELAARVERLARALAACGVGHDEVVPLLMDRGIPLLTAILAVLRLGAAYLPLDPGHPERRLAQILDGARSARVVSSRGHAVRIAAALDAMAPARRPRVVVQEELLGGAPPSKGELPRGLPEALAYVIFTSGSTGQPKGVMVEARGLLNNIRAKVEDLPLTARDVVAQTASQCFDISVWQHLAALAAGGVVHIVADEVARDPPRLLAELERGGITILEIVPALLQALLDEIERRGPARPALASLRWVMPTGEAVPADLCRRWLALHPRVPLLNLYGPSECSDDVSAQAVTAPWEAGDAITPIGRPLRNSRLHVLDAELNPVPIGVPGELCIGGLCVGRGYLFAAARTAASFVPDRLTGLPGARLYRSGDLARYLADGRVEFLGRLDHQLKVRGFRVETGEIESVLRQHEAVAQAVLVARRDGPAAAASLVAYVVRAVERAGDAPPAVLDARDAASRLRAHLAERLPDYMVPSAFVFLERLPLSANGKIDLGRLPAPEAQLDGAPSTPPRTRTERQLAEIWREVLGREQIGVEQNFFDLGGHSLLAIQVLSRLRAALGVDLPLRELFEATTIATLAARVDAAAGSPLDLAALAIPPLAAGEAPPLSFAQERLWFLDQLDPASPAYNLPSAVLLEGSFDAALFAAILNAIVARHAALRTTFTVVGGRPRQRVHAALPIRVPVVDLSGLPAAAIEAETLRLATLEAQLPFDLERGPLLRAWLLARTPPILPPLAAEQVLLLDLHHIVSDAWSMGVLLSEVAALYRAHAAGVPPELPELPVQYPDFASWQRAAFQGEILARQLGFWKQQLAGAPDVLDLPLRSSAPDVLRQWRGATRWFRLGEDLSASLRVVSRRGGTTLFMTLLAGFAAVLHRYTRATDLMIGIPVAGRGRPELERLIGFFVNTLVVRADLAGRPSGEELLRRVRQVTLDAFSHQDLPFERLVAEINPERNLDRSPLFQVMFALQNAPLERLELPGLRLRRLDVETGTTRFELFLEMIESAAEIEGALHHSSDRFDPPFIARFLSHFQTLLEGMAADPRRELGALALLSPGEQAQLLREWNDTARELPREQTFQEIFAARAARHPDRVAAACAGETSSYGELDRRAGALAQRLLAEGLPSEGVVALLAERGLGFLIAMLGVFKAGGAYLPLDTHHPPSRLRQILAQSRCSLVLCSAALRPLLEESLAELRTARPAVFELDTLAALAAGAPAAPAPGVPAESAAGAMAQPAPAPGALPSPSPGAPAIAERLAYVIFTSGSTGMPKGAMLTHRGMINHLWAKIMDLGLTAADVVAQTASPCFDISVWQFLAPLAVGGRVEIYADEVAHDPAVLLDRLEADGVTVLETVPSLLRLMLAEIARRDGAAPPLGRLRWLIPTGEALAPALCREWGRAYPRVLLLNAYGPTECSDDVSHYRVPAADAAARSIAIGRPVANTQLYVLDAALRPVPLGVAGELCAGGEGVGRGYLFDPARTAAAFVPDPCAGRTGARLYRTGDLARQRADGRLDFLGRLDHQVKIRGFRLELGEVEALLAEHPALAAAVVAAAADAAGGKRLVAYIVPRTAAAAPDPLALRELLASRLPDYAIPTAWVTLAAMPLTAGGKLDRRALPDPAAEGPGREGPYTAPRGEMEQAVAEIFAAVVGVVRVGAFDNFFALGGHSLLATQATWRLRETFGVELALRAVFEAPTVAELAAVVEDAIVRQIETLSDDEVDALLAPGAEPAMPPG
jgi:amino acid adenylation domain-containing protein/FkbH-like protein